VSSAALLPGEQHARQAECACESRDSEQGDGAARALAGVVGD
jgi:hypothetical protein